MEIDVEKLREMITLSWEKRNNGRYRQLIIKDVWEIIGQLGEEYGDYDDQISLAHKLGVFVGESTSADQLADKIARHYNDDTGETYYEEHPRSQPSTRELFRS